MWGVLMPRRPPGGPRLEPVEDYLPELPGVSLQRDEAAAAQLADEV